METKLIEAVHGLTAPGNWGKFCVARFDFDTEWARRAQVDVASESAGELPPRSLLAACGWGGNHVWVMDLQTGEGACFRPGGHPSADLNKHRIWVCPLFEPFLEWLYKQDLTDLGALPDVVELPDAPFADAGYRRAGPVPESATRL